MIDCDAPSLPRSPRHDRRLAWLLVGCTGLPIAGCGDQVVVEGVNVADGAVVGDSVIDNPPAGSAASAGEPYATGDPYEEAMDGEKNLGPNAPGYIPETID